MVDEVILLARFNSFVEVHTISPTDLFHLLIRSRKTDDPRMKLLAIIINNFNTIPIRINTDEYRGRNWTELFFNILDGQSLLLHFLWADVWAHGEAKVY